MKVEIYSDIVCPWCYIGERRFERALQAFGPAGRDVEVVFRPYQLDPGAPAQPRPLREYLAARYGSASVGMLSRVTEVAEGEGIIIDWDNAVAVNTLTAHRLMWLAEHEYGREVQAELAEKLFELHFSRGGDVSDVRELTDASTAVGMDATRVADFLASTEALAEVRAEIEAARRLGIQAVPTFVFDQKFAVQGAQPVSLFLRALEEARSSSVEPHDSDEEEGEGAGCEGDTCAV